MASTWDFRSGASQRQGEGARKNFPRVKPRNPLKSLDSDERIQGNPRQSKAHERRPSQRNGQEPRKPKRIDRTDVVGALRLGRQGSGQPTLERDLLRPKHILRW
jgi:hypothetical protein